MSDMHGSRFQRFGATPSRLPEWMRKHLSQGHQARHTDNMIDRMRLHTICQSGKCPNRNECFHQKTASFMILGDRCTRNCHYCSVVAGKPSPPDPQEPTRVAEAVSMLGLEHVVITSVTRDDLQDEGVEHFGKVIQALRGRQPNLIIEILTPDFKRDQERAVAQLTEMDFDIFNHNIETVRSVHARVRSKGGYQLSLDLLRKMNRALPQRITKSGAMLGLGETKGEVLQMLRDLRDTGCRMITLGQYLQPDASACPVVEFVHPRTFLEYKQEAFEMGYDWVESGVFVRSSYHAKESFDHLKRLMLTNKEKLTRPKAFIHS